MTMNQELSKESRTRSFIKALSWRLIAFTVLGIISYSFTRSWKETTYITIVYNVVQIFIYFLHERLWGRIGWGKAKVSLPRAEELNPEEIMAIQGHLKELGYIE